MNQMVFEIESLLDDPHPDDLEHLALTLCDRPTFTISTHWPWLEAELILWDRCHLDGDGKLLARWLLWSSRTIDEIDVQEIHGSAI